MLENGNAMFLVRDNGVGIPSNQLTTLLDLNCDLASEQYTSIGLRNVDKRIKLYYGPQYGLHIESALSEGATVRVTLPGFAET